MALRITPNPRAAGRLSIAANQLARMSSIVSIGWDDVTGKPDLVEPDEVRERLTANRTYYVRSASGSNSNDGLTSGAAFLTLPYAASLVMTTLDLNGYTVTIDIAGTFTSSMRFAGPMTGFIVVSASAATTITTNDTNCIDAYNGAAVTITGNSNLTLRTTTSTTLTPACLAAFALGEIDFSGISFGPSVGPHLQAGWSLSQAVAPGLPGPGTITATGNYGIAAGANLSHMHVTAAGSAINIHSGVTVTLTGTPSFSAYFVGVRTGGIVYANGTYSGSATTPAGRFFVHEGAMLQVPAGAGLSYFPGSVDGINRAGGLYVESDDANSYFSAGVLQGGAAAGSTLTLQSTSHATPSGDAIIFKTDAIEVGRIVESGKWNIGPNAGVPTALLTVMANTAVAAAPPVTSTIHSVGTDGSNNGITLDVYGGTEPAFIGRLANGALGSKTGVVATNTLNSFEGYGWDTTDYGQGGAIRIRAIGTWSNTSHPSEWAIRAIATSSTTPSDKLVINGNTGVAVTDATATALAVGRQGLTNPVLQVDASTASVATGIKVKGAAAAGGVAVSVITSGTNENLTIDAAGSGTVTINGTGTGAISLARDTTITGTETITSSNANALAVGRQGATNPVLQVDASTASVVTGLKIKGAAAASGLALSVVTSGTNEPLTIDSAGSGAITLGGTSTGDIRHARNTNMSTTGPTVAADALLTLQANTAASVAISGSLTPQLHIVGADAGNAGIAAHAYGNKIRLEVYQANGTQASKTATSAASDIFGFNAYGWDTSDYQIGAQFTFTPSETWSGSARGTHIRFLTTAPTTTTLSEKMRIHGSGGVVVGSAFATDPGAGHFRATAALASKIPTTFTGTSGTVGNDDSVAIFNPSGGFTATLPTASSYVGRWLHVKTIAAQTVSSASSNVIPRAGGAAGTAILAAAAGNWALLQSNGTNWEIMAGS